MKSLLALSVGGLFVGVFVLLLSPVFIKAQSVGGAAIKENLDLPFDALGASEEEEDAPEIVTFYGTQLEGDGFFYVIDGSGTMRDRGELAIAKKEVIKNISEFSDRVQFGVVFFAHEIAKFPASGQPADASPGMKQSGINFVQSNQGSSGTCGQKAMAAILQMANQATSKRKVIVYLSDGGGTCDVNSAAEEAAYLQKQLALTTSQNYQRIQINTIGVLDLTPAGEAFMKQLASTNGGTYTRKNG